MNEAVATNTPEKIENKNLQETISILIDYELVYIYIYI